MYSCVSMGRNYITDFENLNLLLLNHLPNFNNFYFKFSKSFFYLLFFILRLLADKSHFLKFVSFWETLYVFILTWTSCIMNAYVANFYFP